MILRNLSTLLLILVITGGCSTIHSVKSKSDTSFDFAEVKTYGWLEEAPTKSGDPRLSSPVFNSIINKAIEADLKKRGLKPASVQPDILVGHHIIIERKTLMMEVDNHLTISVARGSAAPKSLPHKFESTPYELGTLIIDIADRASGKLIWRGSAKATVLQNVEFSVREKRINEGVKIIISSLPSNLGN